MRSQDMVIDRVSSCLCLHFAARSVLDGNTCFTGTTAEIVAFVLRALILLVELIAHSDVLFVGVDGTCSIRVWEQIQVKRRGAEDKKYLFWSCLSFELFGLSLIVDSGPIAVLVMLLSLPGFVFRAAANICRLIAIVTKKELTKWTSKEEAQNIAGREKASVLHFDDPKIFQKWGRHLRF
eukprot:g2999.t1